MLGLLRPKIVDRYLSNQILQAVLFVLVAFLALFTFLDLVNELGSVGKGNYRFMQAFIFVLLGVPAHIYELLPIAGLIGAIYVFAQLAANSEFTILRASGMSVWQSVKLVVRIGLLLVAITYLVGEYVSPPIDQFAQRLRLNALGNSVAGNFRSGAWIKDSPPNRTRFINVEEINPDATLSTVKIYEFDQNFRLISLRIAERAQYIGSSNNGTINNEWRLQDVSETLFAQESLSDITPQTATQYQQTPLVTVKHLDELHWQSELSPTILGAMMIVDPDKMPILDLVNFVSHLNENKQDSSRYQIAFWKKVIYPFAVLVMLLLALPFAYIHSRAGGVSLKVFGGIMLGVTFTLVNNLFAHIGLLNHWMPVMAAIAPSLIYLGIAIIALKWLNRT